MTSIPWLHWLEKMGFVDHFDVSLIKWTQSDSIIVWFKNQVNWALNDQPSLIASFEKTESNCYITQIFWPWYGLFLMTALIHTWLKNWWKKIELTADTGDVHIITQEALERFYSLFGFVPSSRYPVYSYLTLDLGNFDGNVLTKFVQGKLDGNHDIQDGKIVRISPTTKGRWCEPYDNPFHQ